MSRAEEFRNLMLHAAARLEENEPAVRRAFLAQRERAGTELGRSQAVDGLVAFETGQTYARLVLELVASFLVDDEPDEEDR